MLKWNKLLLNDGDSEAFDERIEPTAAQRAYLDSCRTKIRDCIRDGIRRASVSVLGFAREVNPRFRLQGSWSYRTCVQKAHATQEMDLDYGVYLPVRVFEDRSPRVAAKAYFELVEKLLERLCEAESWTLDRSKDTCIRVKVARWAHIDVPLYAAPENLFVTIQENTAVLKAEHAEFREALDLAEKFWEEMEDIHLAKRDGSWKPSDPAAVTRWWREQVAGQEQLRRVCRYLKAWRDLWWPTGGPSSVALMIALAQGYQEHCRRDDMALEVAAEHLINALLGPLHEPGIDGGQEDFLKGLSLAERKEASERARVLASRLRLARGRSIGLRNDSLVELREQLGDRIPDRPDWIEVDGGADVRSTPATIVPPPAVASTESG